MPENTVTLSIIDRNFNTINQYLKNTVITKELVNVLDGIDTHPDMCICPLGDNLLVVEPTVYEYYFNLLKNYGFELIKGESILSKNYPYDIAYNCVILNNILFHKLSHTDNKIIEYAEKFNFKKVDVRQGYTKCSTLIIDNNSVITSDICLHKAYIDNGIDSLYVSYEGINLKGFSNGLIGGCGGLINKNLIAFFGNIYIHKDFKDIEKFLKKRNIDIVSLSDDELTDFGSIIPLLHN